MGWQQQPPALTCGEVRKWPGDLVLLYNRVHVQGASAAGQGGNCPTPKWQWHIHNSGPSHPQSRPGLSPLTQAACGHGTRAGGQDGRHVTHPDSSHTRQAVRYSASISCQAKATLSSSYIWECIHGWPLVDAELQLAT